MIFDDKAFAGCSDVRCMIISNNLTSVGEEVFRDFSNVILYYWGIKNPECKSNAFLNAKNITVLVTKDYPDKHLCGIIVKVINESSKNESTFTPSPSQICNITLPSPSQICNMTLASPSPSQICNITSPSPSQICNMTLPSPSPFEKPDENNNRSSSFMKILLYFFLGFLVFIFTLYIIIIYPDFRENMQTAPQNEQQEL